MARVKGGLGAKKKHNRTYPNSAMSRIIKSYMLRVVLFHLGLKNLFF